MTEVAEEARAMSCKKALTCRCWLVMKRGPETRDEGSFCL